MTTPKAQRHPKPDCPVCASSSTRVLTGRPKYLTVDGVDQQPPRRVMQCRECHAEYEVFVVIRVLTASPVTPK